MSNEPDEVNSGAVATAIVLVALATMAIALVVEALVRNTTAEVLVAKDQTQENAFRHLKSEQVGSLTEAPAWRDRASGLVSVPVDRAMEMVLIDIRENPYAMSPGYKPPEEKQKCAEGESCLPCAEGETCLQGACPPGQKCVVPPADCPPGQTCPELTQVAPSTPEPMSSTGSTSHARGVSPAAPVDAGASPTASPQPETVPALTGPAESAP